MTLEELTQLVLNLKRQIEDLPNPTGVRFTNATVSPNWSQGVSGWKIGENGDVEFNSGTFRGALSANSINIPSSATGWHVDTSGNMWWGSYATFSASQSAGATRIGADGAATFTSLTISGYIPTGGAASDVNSGVVTISGGKITASSISADRMNVSQLSAISANLGTITAGNITMPAAGFVRAGQSSWDSGTGFYLGNDSGTPRLSIGISSGNKLTWDGARLFMKVSSNGGFVMQMPSSGASKFNAGFIVQDSNGTGVLKINDNAFITTFGRAFSAASNTSGTYGSDWFNMFCENDLGVSAGVLELPSTNRMLIKRSGGGQVIRISASAGTGTGKVDFNEQVSLRQLSNVPGAASSYTGSMYYDTGVSDIVFSNGSAWYKVTASLR